MTSQNGTFAITPQNPIQGNIVGLTIVVDFNDVKISDTGITVSDIEQLFNADNYNEFGNNGSVKEYFKYFSGGKLNYTNIVLYYCSPNNKSDFTSIINQGEAAGKLIKEALTALDNTVDFSTLGLTLDENNQVMALNVIYAGDVQNGWGQGLWPHQGIISLLNPFTVDGITFSSYQVSEVGSELSIGTIIHENGHMICGWNDTYDRSFQSNGTGYYDLMGAGNDDKNPVPPNPYYRCIVSGWGDVINLTNSPSGSTIFINTQTINAYIYINNDRPSEFFMIERITKSGRWANFPDDGFIIWHVDSLLTNNHNKYHMTPSSHYMISVEQADGNFDLERKINYGNIGDLYHAGNIFNDTSTPNSRWWSGDGSGLEISEISDIQGTFKLTYPQVTHVHDWQWQTYNEVIDEFTCPNKQVYQKKICSICGLDSGETRNFYIYFGHNWEWRDTFIEYDASLCPYARCWIDQICTICYKWHNVDDVIIKYVGHQWEWVEDDSRLECPYIEYLEHEKCKICGELSGQERMSRKVYVGHVWSLIETTQKDASTCPYAELIVTARCNNCGHEELAYTDEVYEGHDWGWVEYDSRSECPYTVYLEREECSTCGVLSGNEREGREIYVGHQWEWVEYDSRFECPYTVYLEREECSICGELSGNEREGREVYVGHDWTIYETTEMDASTCPYSVYIVTKRCDYCDYEEIIYTEYTYEGHDWVWVEYDQWFECPYNVYLEREECMRCGLSGQERTRNYYVGHVWSLYETTRKDASTCPYAEYVIIARCKNCGHEELAYSEEIYEGHDWEAVCYYSYRSGAYMIYWYDYRCSTCYEWAGLDWQETVYVGYSSAPVNNLDIGTHFTLGTIQDQDGAKIASQITLDSKQEYEIFKLTEEGFSEKDAINMVLLSGAENCIKTLEEIKGMFKSGMSWDEIVNVSIDKNIGTGEKSAEPPVITDIDKEALEAAKKEYDKLNSNNKESDKQENHGGAKTESENLLNSKQQEEVTKLIEEGFSENDAKNIVLISNAINCTKTLEEIKSMFKSGMKWTEIVKESIDMNIEINDKSVEIPVESDINEEVAISVR